MPGSFGLPAPDIMAGAVNQIIQANGGALSQVAADAQEPLSTIAAANAALLSQVNGAAQQQLAQTTASNSAQLSSISDVAKSALAAQTGAVANQSAILSAASSQQTSTPQAITNAAAGGLVTTPGIPIANRLGYCYNDIHPITGQYIAGGNCWTFPCVPIGGYLDPQQVSIEPCENVSGFTTPPQTAPATDQTALDSPLIPPGVPLTPVSPPAPTPAPTDVATADQLPETPLIPPGATLTPVTPAPPPQGPPFPCPVIPDLLSGGFPPPGSAEWCKIADLLVGAVGQVGTMILDWVQGNLDPAKALSWLDNYQSQGSVSNPGGYVVDALVAVVRPALDQLAPLIDNLLPAITCLWNLQKQLFARCDVTAVSGLVVVRIILHSLHKIRAGADPAVWATVDINLVMGPLERNIDILIDYACPMTPPSPEEAEEALKRGYISQEQFRCIQRIAGRDPDAHRPLVMGRQEFLPIREAIQYVRRQGGGSEQELGAILTSGVLDPNVAAQFQFMFDELPTVGDFLHFLTRNVFDTEYVKRYNLLEGFEERFWANFGDDLRAIGMKKEYAALHYAAHWIQPAPTQMQEFLFRLRPNKPGVDNPFTVDDYKRLLTEQDYAPLAREWFASTAYNVPALGYIRDMYRQGIITDADLVGYHQDLGYTEDDSRRFMGVDRLQRDRMRAAATSGWTPPSIVRAVVSGSISDDAGRILFTSLGWTEEEYAAAKERVSADLRWSTYQRSRQKVLTQTVSELRASLQAGILAPSAAIVALTGLGWPVEFATAFVQTEQATARAGFIKQAIAVVRRAFLDAYLTVASAATSLQQLGIQADAVAQYLSLWQLQLTPARRRRTASQIMSDVANAEITTEEGMARLLTLGYSDADSRLFLADARRKILARGAKEQAALARNQQRAAKQIAAEQKTAARQAKDLIAALKRISSPAKLQKWAKLGIVGKDVFEERMRLFGIDEVDIQRWWKEACDAKNAACLNTTPPPNGQAPSG